MPVLHDVVITVKHSGTVLQSYSFAAYNSSTVYDTVLQHHIVVMSYNAILQCGYVALSYSCNTRVSLTGRPYSR